jgi:raffinose/stachyose/melibiose transport system permease protein
MLSEPAPRGRLALDPLSGHRRRAGLSCLQEGQSMRKAKHPLVFWLFLAPVLLAFTIVIVIPFVLGVYYSFTNWTATARLGDSLKVVGLRNFADILKDPSFTYSFILTVVYTVLNMIAINVVSFTLAMLVTM